MTHRDEKPASGDKIFAHKEIDHRGHPVWECAQVALRVKARLLAWTFDERSLNIFRLNENEHFARRNTWPIS